MTVLFSNNASTTIAGSITATDTTVNLAAGTGIEFPSPLAVGDYFVATFYDQATKTLNEIVHVTHRAGDVCTIVRGQEGTTPLAWTAGDIFANLITAGTLEAFVQIGPPVANTGVVYVGDDVGTQNHIVANTTPVPADYALGMLFNIRVKNTNSHYTDMALNGKPPILIKRTDGSDVIGTELTAGQEYPFIFNGTFFNSCIMPVPQRPPQTVFYVRSTSTSTVLPDGTETNDGLANTDSSAFRWIQGAINTLKARYISQTGLTIRVADGLYYGGSFYDSSSYIASWNIVGNPYNPGAVIIDATSTSPAAYPAGAPVSSCAGVGGTAVMSVNGFSFRSWANNAGALGSGNLSLRNCNYSSPLNGEGCILSSAHVYIAGNNQYTGSNSCFCLFYAGGGGHLGMGFWGGGVFGDDPVTFTFNVNPTRFSGGTALCDSAGSLNIYDSVATFYYSHCHAYPYYVYTGGGIYFYSGNTNIFPGNNVGQVISPGWILT